MKRAIGAILGLFLGLAIIAGGLGYWGYARYAMPGPLSETTTVVIPKGATRDDIMRRLLAGRVIEDSFIFRLALRLTGSGGKLKAGEYRFPAKISMARLIERLVAGKTVLRLFTAFEGKTTHEILERLRGTEGLDGEISIALSEGDLLPETYSFALGDTRDSMIKRMRAAMEDALNVEWAKRAPGLPIKTKREALILASIIEKETGVASERARVAAVFVNRLRIGMRLQSDPTVIYGITNGKGPLKRRLLIRDLEKKTPYNTYRIKGLPPGPIANPGRAAIEAALNPAKTKELYFVADGTGGHAFAKTLQEHNRNVRKWRAYLKKRRAQQRKKKASGGK